MKDYLQVQKDRIKYHIQPRKNTVHRSSLIVPEMKNCNAWIGFINHFLLKRGYKSVALKVCALDKYGNLLDSLTFEINQLKVYSFNLSKVFSKSKAFNYLVEFYSGSNLFIPFPAVIISHWGKDFCNVVHSYNRILNDVFENDQVNKTEVSESSFDLQIDKKYDTFFNISSGISDIKKGNIKLNYKKDNINITKKINISLPRLSQKTFYLSKYLPSKTNGGILKIKQPKQNLFFGRLLAGRMNKNTGAFSANHSYYDSSIKKEYFSSPESFRTYPYFKDFNNEIRMYPIFSPCKLDIKIKVFTKNGYILSPSFKFLSSSKSPCIINVNEFINSKGIKDITAFTLIAKSSNNRIPTRVNHQLNYGEHGNKNPLKCSINVSLINEKMFVPKKRESFVWGQFIKHKNYTSKIGFCFNSSDGKTEKITIDFYNSNGKVKTIKQNLLPGRSIIINSDKVLGKSKFSEFNWYVAKSKRADLGAYSVHHNKISKNFSGEHHF
mgnify:CR=1 FL=1